METNDSLVEPIDPRPSLISGLPWEILYRVLNCLALRDLVALSFTCKFMYSTCQSPLTYVHLEIDKRIKVKKVLRKGDRHFFVATRSITSLDCLPVHVEHIINTKFQNFPKLESVNFMDSPTSIKFMKEMVNEIAKIPSIKLCVTVPHVFPSSGFWTGEQQRQLKMILAQFLSRILQSECLREVCIMFALDDSICNIGTTDTKEYLQLDLLRMPRRVCIENLALFNFEIADPSFLFSKLHSLQEFRLTQQMSSTANFTLPICFSFSAPSKSSAPPPPASLRSLYLDPSVLLMKPECDSTSFLSEASLHRDYHSLNWLPKDFISCIDYSALAFLDLSHFTSPLALHFELKSLRNLEGLNIFHQSAFLSSILEHVQTHQNALFPKLTQLNIAGVQCSQLFDQVPKESLLIFLSQLTKLKSLTLTPCMLLTKFKFSTYCICVHKLFALCPYISTLRVTDENLVKCQLCVEEYSNLVLTRQPTHNGLLITKLSLHYTQGIIGNFGTLLVEEISFFRLPYLTHLNICTDRVIPALVLSHFLKSNCNIEALSFECPIEVMPIFCESLHFLSSLKSLFLIADKITDLNALATAISDNKGLSIVWLHFTSQSLKQVKEIKSRIVLNRDVAYLKVNYSNRQSSLADAMYIKILTHLYRRSGLQ